MCNFTHSNYFCMSSFSSAVNTSANEIFTGFSRKVIATICIVLTILLRVARVVKTYNRAVSRAWVGSVRNGNLVVEIENCASEQDGKQRKQDKPFSNSVSTPTSFSRENNGVSHLTAKISHEHRIHAAPSKSHA